MEQTAPKKASDRTFYALNACLSAGVLSFLVYWLWMRRVAPGFSGDLSLLPSINAACNAVAAAFLIAGYVAIRRRAVRVHKFCMVSAFAASVLFFIGYVTYHYAHGETRFQGSGGMRIAYFIVLASHVLLSMAVVPLAPTTLYLALKGDLRRHRTLARVALPIWLYVSVTGVAIYFALRAFAPESGGGALR